jgi:hypothetical protein
MKRITPDRRLELERRASDLAAKLAADASQRADVKEFRANLSAQLPTRNEHGVFHDAATATAWLRANDRADDAGVDVAGLLLDSSAFAETLGHPRHRPAPRTFGMLGRLRPVVESLVREFPWSMRDATLFVLTGAPPAVSLVRTIRGSHYFVMMVDEFLTSTEVRSIFERRDFADDGGWYLPVKIRALRLFLSERPDDESSKSQMEAWNAAASSLRVDWGLSDTSWRTDPWCYSSDSTFRRDRADARAGRLGRDR